MKGLTQVFNSIHYGRPGLTRKVTYDNSHRPILGITEIEYHMYRIVKRIVRKIKTITWSIRWEGHTLGQRAIEERVSLPAGSSITEEEVLEIKKLPNPANYRSSSNQSQGENL